MDMVTSLLPRASDKRLDWPDEPPILTADDIKDRSFLEWMEVAFPGNDRADIRVKTRFFELAVVQVRKFRLLTVGFSLVYYLREMSFAAQAELWNKTLESAGYDLGDD